MLRKGFPVNVRVNRRLSKSESGLSYVRRKRKSALRHWRFIHCADRRMPSAVKAHTLLPAVSTLTYPGACYRWTDCRGGGSFRGVPPWVWNSSVTGIPSRWVFCALCRNQSGWVHPRLLQRETVAVSVGLLIITADSEALNCTAFFLLVSLASSDWPWPNDRPTNQPTNQPTGQPPNHPTHHQTNRPTNQSTNKPSIPPTNQPTHQTTNRTTNPPTNQPTNRPTN